VTETTQPLPLPATPELTKMPLPLSPEWFEWLPSTLNMSWPQMLEVAGCVLRSCRVERLWDDEHNCHVFFHNAKPLDWQSYRRLQPPPQTDHEAFFRCVYTLHAEEDGRDPMVSAPSPRIDVFGLPPEEQKAISRVYAERDCVLKMASDLARIAGVRVYIAQDETQDEEWRNVLFFDLPSGQCAWHIRAKELDWFKHVPRVETNPWDGHSTEVKYGRVLADWPWEPVS
jgi:hypothetical protein